MCALSVALRSYASTTKLLLISDVQGDETNQNGFSNCYMCPSVLLAIGQTKSKGGRELRMIYRAFGA